MPMKNPVHPGALAKANIDELNPKCGRGSEDDEDHPPATSQRGARQKRRDA
jgi:hypothetical protein